MMLRLADETKIFVATLPVDFRKAINGLSQLVVEHYSTSLMDGSVYVFYNRERNKVKCLFWEKNGFVLYHKRLEKGKYKFTHQENEHYVITSMQLDWLLAGLDFMLMQEFNTLDYTQYF